MNCRTFRQWLDRWGDEEKAGSDAGAVANDQSIAGDRAAAGSRAATADRAAAEAHAASCLRCAPLLHAAREVEALLVWDDQPPPADFADRVMRLLPPRATVSATGLDQIPNTPRRARNRRVELAVLTIMIFGSAPLLLRWAGAASRAFAHALGQIAQGAAGEGALLHDPSIGAGLALMLLPAVLLASRFLFRWTAERIAGGAMDASSAAGSR